MALVTQLKCFFSYLQSVKSGKKNKIELAQRL